jgi:hypothetical protein
MLEKGKEKREKIKGKGTGKGKRERKTKQNTLANSLLSAIAIDVKTKDCNATGE